MMFEIHGLFLSTTLISFTSEHYLEASMTGILCILKHISALCGLLLSICKYHTNSIRHIKPGGYIEQIEGSIWVWLAFLIATDLQFRRCAASHSRGCNEEQIFHSILLKMAKFHRMLIMVIDQIR